MNKESIDHLHNFQQQIQAQMKVLVLIQCLSQCGLFVLYSAWGPDNNHTLKVRQKKTFIATYRSLQTPRNL